MTGSIGGIRGGNGPIRQSKRLARKKSKSEEKTTQVASKKREREEFQTSTKKEIHASRTLPAKKPGPKKHARIETEEAVDAKAQIVLNTPPAPSAPTLLSRVVTYIRQPEASEVVDKCTALAGAVLGGVLSYHQVSPLIALPVGIAVKKVVREILKTTLTETPDVKATPPPTLLNRMVTNLAKPKRDDVIDACTDVVGAVLAEGLNYHAVSALKAVPVGLMTKKVTKEMLQRNF